jgi:hypothetical protein
MRFRVSFVGDAARRLTESSQYDGSCRPHLKVQFMFPSFLQKPQ